jgi:DNA uptake protein ComE-like DNA-binding protein
MKHRIVKTALMALGLCLAAQASLAADTHPQKAASAAAQGSRKATPTRKAVAPQPVLVDINSASREQLKKLPGIGDAEADRIIAGRPYLSKAHLQTRKIVSPMVYQGLRESVVAKQKDAKFGKVAGK